MYIDYYEQERKVTRRLVEQRRATRLRPRRLRSMHPDPDKIAILLTCTETLAHTSNVPVLAGFRLLPTGEYVLQN